MRALLAQLPHLSAGRRRRLTHLHSFTGRTGPDVLGGEGLDRSAGPSRVVPVVLSLLPRAAHGGRRPPDLAVAWRHRGEGPLEALSHEQGARRQCTRGRPRRIPRREANASALGVRAHGRGHQTVPQTTVEFGTPKICTKTIWAPELEHGCRLDARVGARVGGWMRPSIDFRAGLIV